jgi:hypothetical protein
MRSALYSALTSVLVVALVSAQSEPPPPPTAPPPSATSLDEVPKTFEKYCFDCHGAEMPEAGLNLEKLLSEAVAARAKEWKKVVDHLTDQMMPPQDASAFPSAAERAEAIKWVQAALDQAAK